MGILVNEYSRVLVQGLTGKEGSFHSKEMMNYGTILVGGVTPVKGGIKHLGIPVFNTIEQAIIATKANVSIIFVTPNFAFYAILEAIFAGISILICITEGIPLLDMIKIKEILKKHKTRLIGPNCPGILTNKIKIGIMPNYIFKNGKIGIVSKSGTLTYEFLDQLGKYKKGISSAIGIGGDPLIGTGFREIIDLFIKDNETKYIILIGEIGGKLEMEAVEDLNKNSVNKKAYKKTLIGFIAGKTAPKGRIMGHAGALVQKIQDTAQFKIDFLNKNGIQIIESPMEIGLEFKIIIEDDSF